MNRPDSNLTLKIVVSSVCVILIALRFLFPNLQVDAVTLGLLVLALLPWLSPLIKSAEVPGVGKIEFQDVKVAIERVANSEKLKLGLRRAPLFNSFSATVQSNPTLPIVGLRIDIEKRLRSLAEKNGLVANASLPRLTNELKNKGLLNLDVAVGLKDLIDAGNKAAHGAEVDLNAANWAVEFGPQVLEVLDKKLEIDVAAHGDFTAGLK